MTDKYLQLDSRMDSLNGLQGEDRRAARAEDRPMPVRIGMRLISLLLLGSGLTGAIVLSNRAAWAGVTLQDSIPDNLIAQDIVDGLPPPPNLPGQAAAQPIQSDRVQAPAAGAYVVVVNGDSPRLLQQVQRVASTATLQEYQGQRVIQVAAFDDSDRAERQVELLASRGIGADIVRVTDANSSSANNSTAPSTSQADQGQQSAQLAATPDLPPPDLLPAQPVPREIEFGGQSTLNSFPSPPNVPTSSTSGNGASGSSTPGDAQSAARSSSPAPQPERAASSGSRRAYYVVIPGKQGELDAISNQVNRLGDGFGIAQLVQQSGSPRGPHVQVGPFVDRDAANRWNRYFRDFGMDARVSVTR
jgi:hypothetical protein